ncbi:glycine betaine ABC transporter substrate-binding protein [Aquabacterium sp. J223]|uniref:glycine betaine ABC transporter substrate-binding protein n=1 Tax=Aquabacterium sp. J223 TaxID=2898431 RepID=UPI0021AE135F|nr:glycine betaine ABC transporter substrate-binding protein [Aquabacterium sp. J223]UUX95047.1 ABC transporter permease subunit [Aquabacterium sp. J223]
MRPRLLPTRRWFHRLLPLLLLAAVVVPARSAADAELVVGSKRFTESYVLGELLRQTALARGEAASHRPGLGNTAVLAQALATGAVDVYPEYTGTIERELLGQSPAGAAPVEAVLARLNAGLAPRGLKAAVPLGFANGYALALKDEVAARLGLSTLSDLAGLPAAQAATLRLGLSHEFLQRADGWPGLRRAYGLSSLRAGNGLDHGLAYQALADGQVDIVDVYTTDAQVQRLGLRVLRDDRGFFPRYDAVLLMRAAVDPSRFASLAGRLDEATMQRLNAQVELDGRAFDAVAADFLRAGGGAPSTAAGRGFVHRLFAPDLPRLLGQHLMLVAGSLALALATGVPLGLWAQRRPRWRGVVMGAVGLLQTVPSLALLAFLIAAVGRIGFWPALLALWLYALLPIVRNTEAGLSGVPTGLTQAGRALGLRPAQVLRHVELPLALPVLLAGVKTAAVVNVGTATVAAFIGAGGLGERIVSGLAVNDSALMLAGAVPAAALALALQAGFGVVEWVGGEARVFEVARCLKSLCVGARARQPVGLRGPHPR